MEVSKELLTKKDFTAIHVTEICEKVKISKVTFFRYFPQKEDILLYIIRIWMLSFLVEMHKKPLKGKQAIMDFFQKLIKFHEKHPSIFPHILKHYAESEKILKPINIKKAEKQLLYPKNEELKEIEILSMDRILEKHLLEAVFIAEIKQSSNVEEMQRLLMSVFYGSVLLSKMKQFPLSVLFKRNLELALDMLK